MVRWLQQLRTPLTNSLQNNIIPPPSTTRTILPTSTRCKDSQLSNSIYHLGTCKVASTFQPQRCKTFTTDIVTTTTTTREGERKIPMMYHEHVTEYIKTFFTFPREGNCNVGRKMGRGILENRKTGECNKIQRRRYSTKTEVDETGLKKTPIHDFHIQNGGKMVPFSGFLLPVSYGSDSISTSHLHTRAHSSLFDVSHMMQTEIRGKHRDEFLESITTADIKSMKEDESKLTIFTDPDTGGILDDLIVTKTHLNYLHVVSNAGRRLQDQKLMKEAAENFKAKGKDVNVKFLEPEEKALIALQGPASAAALSALVDTDLNSIYFMESRYVTIAGIKFCRVTRCGYTGEDGFEMSIPGHLAIKVVSFLVEEPGVRLAGLGARDSLRLEAGLCLYGNDIDQTTTPVEAGLSWLIAKRRRADADFPGAKIILKQLKDGVMKRRVGLRAAEGPPVRSGARVLTNDEMSEEVVGYITSGGPSPTLGENIAMGYVPKSLSKPGTKLRSKVRDRTVSLTVCKMPFVPTRYYFREGDE